jgi:hypothetical protein
MGGLCLMWTGCDTGGSTAEGESSYYSSCKPYTRWWWFATEIRKPDIRHQLDWVKAHNFGGVEIAWMYPLYRYNQLYGRTRNRQYPADSSAQEWLSDAWMDVVTYAKRYADSIGIGCDFTFGSTWHLGDSFVPVEDGTRIYGDSTFEQSINFSWEYPTVGRVVNHLDSNAFYRLAERITTGLTEAFRGSRSALFADSWEIKLNATHKIWTGGFENRFRNRFGYDITPFMDSLDAVPDVRYDYMLLLGDMAMEHLYKPFTKVARRMGGFSRVQCLASPTDVMAAYALVDVPESEAMLNNPNYSRIVSSAAALASKPVVSCEAFTCMYGFPGTYLREEQTADLKLVADALFAEGVNQFFYHGMPYNPRGCDTNEFFASVYVGPNGSLTEELPQFNTYLQTVSWYMRKGRPYSDVAVYIPFEDGVMAGAYPPERQRVWVWGQYEMRYISPPVELAGYHPLWINRHFLEEARFENGRLHCGDVTFSTLYVDVTYLDARALDRILELARQGLSCCVKQRPRQPGLKKGPDYHKKLDQLLRLPNVGTQLAEVMDHGPLVRGDSVPAYWARQEGDDVYIFFAHPFCKDLAYPIYSGQSWSDSTLVRPVVITTSGQAVEVDLRFAPYQSLLVRVNNAGKVAFEDIRYVPRDPVIRPREPQKMYF